MNERPDNHELFGEPPSKDELLLDELDSLKVLLDQEGKAPPLLGEQAPRLDPAEPIPVLEDVVQPGRPRPAAPAGDELEARVEALLEREWPRLREELKRKLLAELRRPSKP